MRKALRLRDAAPSGPAHPVAEPLVLVLEAEPARRRRIAGIVRAMGVDVFELGKLEHLRPCLARSRRRPDAWVVGLPIATNELEGFRTAALTPLAAPLLCVARSGEELAPAGLGPHAVVVLQAGGPGDELARAVRRALQRDDGTAATPRSA